MDINLKPEDFETFIKEAILKAGLGALVDRNIKEALKGYNNPVDKALQELIQSLARKILTSPPYADTIERMVLDAVKLHVTDDLIQRVSGHTVNRMIQNI